VGILTGIARRTSGVFAIGKTAVTPRVEITSKERITVRVSTERDGPTIPSLDTAEFSPTNAVVPKIGTLVVNYWLFGVSS
jgi:hypothetical protein